MSLNPLNPSRPPDVVIGSPHDPYLLRWHVIPRNRFLNVYLHEFWRDDDDRAHHDHPWWSLSVLLSGSLLEHMPFKQPRIVNQRGQIIIRKATHMHRLEVLEKPSRTLFITGPKIREWGFACPQGWRHWKDFVSGSSKGEVGRGCS